jgi:uncharacterized membrane protein
MDLLSLVHPKVVHFPIAFLLVYLLLELIGAIFKKEFYSKAAHLFLLFGVLGALVATFTGDRAVDAFEGWNKTTSGVLKIHHNYATITTWFFAVLLVLRTIVVLRKKFTPLIKYGFVLLAVIGTYFIILTGDNGGKMVYIHGVGTEYYNKASSMKDSLNGKISDMQDKIDSLENSKK